MRSSEPRAWSDESPARLLERRGRSVEHRAASTLAHARFNGYDAPSSEPLAVCREVSRQLAHIVRPKWDPRCDFFRENADEQSVKERSNTDAREAKQWCVAALAKVFSFEETVIMSRITKVTVSESVRGLIAGTQKHPPSGPLTLGGQPFTAQSLVQVLQDMGSALSAVDTAKASWKDALKNLDDVKAKVDPTLGAYRSWVLATYGNAPATLADFGLTPPKARTPMTVEQKAAAGAKREATRAARHTLGPKQKKLIKGTVAATPPTVGAAQAPAPASASTASPAAPAKPIG